MNDQTKEVLANFLMEQRSSVLENWVYVSRVQTILENRRIGLDFFIFHFGSRVVDYFISILKNKSLPGTCPVISVMLHFFSGRGLLLHEVFHICSGMKSTVVNELFEQGYRYSDGLYATTIELFELNFAGVIQEYMDVVASKQQKTRRPRKVLETSARSVSKLLKEPLPAVKFEADNSLLDEYFAKDSDEGCHNIIFESDDAEDILEYFAEIPELLSLAVIESNATKIKYVAKIFAQVSAILSRYSPYIDSLSLAMKEFSNALESHPEEFMEVLINSNDEMLGLFDAVRIDMDRYVRRFSVESMAMKNAHHIHEPTSLSIMQIISMFGCEQFEESEIEFF